MIFKLTHFVALVFGVATVSAGLIDVLEDDFEVTRERRDTVENTCQPANFRAAEKCCEVTEVLKADDYAGCPTPQSSRKARDTAAVAPDASSGSPSKKSNTKKRARSTKKCTKCALGKAGFLNGNEFNFDAYNAKFPGDKAAHDACVAQESAVATDSATDECGGKAARVFKCMRTKEMITSCKPKAECADKVAAIENCKGPSGKAGRKSPGGKKLGARKNKS